MVGLCLAVAACYRQQVAHVAPFAILRSLISPIHSLDKLLQRVNRYHCTKSV